MGGTEQRPGESAMYSRGNKNENTYTPHHTGAWACMGGGLRSITARVGDVGREREGEIGREAVLAPPAPSIYVQKHFSWLLYTYLKV